ncbi:DUF5684 domain-containing protein [Agromyces soli]
MRVLSSTLGAIAPAEAAPSALGGLGSALLIALPLVLLVWAALYVWTGLAGSRLFARTGGEPWKAWVPFVNEAEIFARGDKPAYSLVYCFIPVVAIYGLVVRVMAVHRINERFGRGAGSTVLGIVLPPVWMSVLAWGRGPVQESPARSNAVVEDAIDAAVAFAPRDASGYAIPVATPIEVQPLEPAAPQVRPAPVAAGQVAAAGLSAAPVEAPPAPAAPSVAAAPVAPVAAAAPVEPAPAAGAASAAAAAAAPVAAQPASRAQWRVELADGTAFDLNAPRIVLGRNPEPATPDEQRIALPDQTRTLSKTHARLVYADGAWRLSDLASTNGTAVVDASGAAFELQPGEPTVVAERFRLGEVELRLAYDLVG